MMKDISFAAVRRRNVMKDSVAVSQVDIFPSLVIGIQQKLAAGNIFSGLFQRLRRGIDSDYRLCPEQILQQRSS